jgi:hypothetical protein
VGPHVARVILPNNAISTLPKFFCDGIAVINDEVLVEDLEDLAARHIRHSVGDFRKREKQAVLLAENKRRLGSNCCGLHEKTLPVAIWSFSLSNFNCRKDLGRAPINRLRGKDDLRLVRVSGQQKVANCPVLSIS